MLLRENKPLKDVKLAMLSDSRMMLSLVRDMLHGFGLRQPILTGEEKQLAEALQHYHVDCLLLDLPLIGRRNAFSVSMDVRYNNRTQNAFMPIILITDAATEKLGKEAINNGIDALMVKPLSARVLQERLQSLVHEPRTYIRTPSGYFGPDRRRRDDPRYAGEERRKVHAAQLFEPGKRSTQDPYRDQAHQGSIAVAQKPDVARKPDFKLRRFDAFAKAESDNADDISEATKDDQKNTDKPDQDVFFVDK